MTQPLSVLMIDSHREIERGGAIQCARLAAALADRGHNVTCVFDGSEEDAGSSGPEWQRLVSSGVAIIRRPLSRFGAMRAFRSFLAERRPDIVHTHKNRALYFLAGAWPGRRKFGWVANRGTVYSLRRSKIAWLLHKWWVDRIIAVADAVRDQLLLDGIAPDRVRTIYGSFDVERFDPATSGEAMRAAWEVPAGAPLIGMAASFKTPKKGHRDFVQAAARILAGHPECYFVLPGDGSPDHIQRYAASLGIAERVRFPGFASDMPAALAAMDVVVCASTQGEGLTGSIREALAMGRPVVSTDVAGNRELVRHGETGLLTPIGDPAALAGAVSSLLDDPDRGAVLGAAGRALVLELCTNEARARQVEQLYRELIAARSAGR